MCMWWQSTCRYFLCTQLPVMLIMMVYYQTRMHRVSTLTPSPTQLRKYVLVTCTQVSYFHGGWGFSRVTRFVLKDIDRICCPPTPLPPRYNIVIVTPSPWVIWSLSSPPPPPPPSPHRTQLVEHGNLHDSTWLSQNMLPLHENMFTYSDDDSCHCLCL